MATSVGSCPKFVPSLLGGIRGRIKRLGWSPCVLFFGLLPVQDDALTSCPTGRPAAAIYRPLYVLLPCRQPPSCLARFRRPVDFTVTLTFREALVDRRDLKKANLWPENDVSIPIRYEGTS
jgi:hypothetical protein